jgi:hypothetical protein
VRTTSAKFSVGCVSCKLGVIAIFAFLLAKLGSIVPPFSIFGPVRYDWDLRLPSPDRSYDLVVIRGDASAFDDFTYRIYVFPHDVSPSDRRKGSTVEWNAIRGEDGYLVYSGYNYPMFRWTGRRSIEIDLHELYVEPFEFNPVKRPGKSDDAILVSLEMDKESAANTMP